MGSVDKCVHEGEGEFEVTYDDCVVCPYFIHCNVRKQESIPPEPTGAAA